MEGLNARLEHESVPFLRQPTADGRRGEMVDLKCLQALGGRKKIPGGGETRI